MTNMTSPAQHIYDPVSSQAALIAMHEFLLQNDGAGVEIDLQSAETVPGRVIELLMVAAKQWGDQNLPITFAAQNPALITRLTEIGVPAHLFSEGS